MAVTTIGTILSQITSPKTKPDYVITVSPTPAGYTYDTSGKLVSTPGTPARPGFGKAFHVPSGRAARFKAEAEARKKAAESAEARRIADELARKRAIEQRLLLAEQERQRQASFGSRRIGGQVTRTDLEPKFDFTGRVHTTPELYETTVGSFTAGGKEIPTTQVVMGAFGGGGAGAKIWTETPATEEERKYFKERTSFLVAGEEKPSFISIISKGKVGSVRDIYQVSEKAVRESITDPTIGRLFKEIDYEHGKTDLTLATKFFSQRPPWSPKGAVETLTGTDIYREGAIKGQLMAGAGLGILEDVRTKPVKSALIYGAGFGIGAGVSGISAGLGTIPRVGGVLASTFKIGTIGAGVYFGGTYGLTIARQVEGAKDVTQVGSILGVAAKDITLGGLGFAKGQATATQLRGWWATRGREELILQQGVYPSAPTSKQLELFRKNIIGELGTKPGAFHTTPQKFWRKEITPEIGTSELPGLYGSTKVSTPFARISGSGRYKLFPSVKDLFYLEGKPAVAYLKPTGFRYSPYQKVSPYKIGEQTFRYAFKEQAKLGYADVPLLKSEIEAVFRPEAGGYLFESGKYFTRIKGVRVPIDVFGYGGKVISVPSKVPTSVSRVFGEGSYSSYTLPSSYPILSPTSLITSYRSLVSSAKPSPSSSTISKTSRDISSLEPSGVSSLFSSGYSPTSLSRSYAPSKAPTPYAPYYSYKETPTRKAPPFILPKPRIRFREKPKTARQLFPAPSRYQPSFTGTILGIQIDIPEHYERFGFGGIRVRGIPTFSTKKSKKKKKKK